MDRYSRNRIYVSEEEQEKVRRTRILLGGAGIGSVIAECALRLGFENIVIADGSKVEVSDLNRQNFVKSDIGKPKAESLAKRLLKINPKANVRWHNMMIDTDNLEELLDRVDIAVNALDFRSDIPFVFDARCSEKRIPVLHPYNFGWGAFLTIVKPGGYQLNEISPSYKGFEIKMAEFVARYCTFWNMPNRWLDGMIEQWRSERGELLPPRLAVASWVVAGHCVNAMFDIITGEEVKYFPKFYFSSIRCDPA
ncbi:MAG: ThiF family adenylyltransferase [Bacteroides sp.]|nr:ThiF family adenylyltransferase [Bacteroides sp.]